MNEEKQKKLFLIGMSVLLILVLLGGGTYAWLTLQLKGTKVNVLKAGNLALILHDENSIGIHQEKAVPTLDKVGETFDPYHFTLENLSDLPTGYTIYLDDLDLEEGEERMSDEYLRYSLTKDGTSRTDDLTSTGENPNRVLDSGTIAGGQTITYDLRLWIDINASNDAMGKAFRSKIRVVAVQEEKEPNKHILHVYQYHETSCLTGEESTCVEIGPQDEYRAGTIIQYQVNDTESKYFHVMFDDKDTGTLTMQQRENTINATKWYDTGTTTGDNSKGPLTVLPALEKATSFWTNVKDQTYTMGVTPFQGNKFTGCSFTECTVNTYTMPQRTGKARMITVQEAIILGCTDANNSCPNWMNNYLKDNESYGGTVAHDTDYGYWTMSSEAIYDKVAMSVFAYGAMGHYHSLYSNYGARAVVVIDKYRFS